ncbi:MAG TPA: YgiQ family radical SAM protein [Clostridiales bacterium]|nr:MAG: YgiQ family radical SAM protein [Clostridiales bacterium GWD2_32_59]HAN10160.1 YgiQ family radical SAM protein [Clostridiales bacterium]
MNNDFLPISKYDMDNRGWDECDFIFVTGDAYIDHPSFGTAIISRVLEVHGYKVGIIPQPDPKNIEDFKKLGRPRLAFLINSGNIDSMVNNYTAAKKKRKIDVYSPGDKAGYRPDRAVIVYCNKVREAYGNVPIIIGGLEASLRRFGHYDYWDDKVRKSIIIDSQADLLTYGMGEHQIVEIADNLNAGIDIHDLNYIKGTVFKARSLDGLYDYTILPEFKEILKDKVKYAESFNIQHKNTDSISGKVLIEPYQDFFVVQNKPSDPLGTKELDDVYSLSYMRTYHPIYEKAGGISAIKEVKFSLLSSRGCFGGCNFCALNFHQGRMVTSRSRNAIVTEAKELIKDPQFKGYIHDVGGPTANFRNLACDKQKKSGVCINKQCLFPEPCKNMKIDHEDYIKLLRELRELKGIKKVFVRSGIRFDYLINDKDETFFNELCEHHISGQLKVAPEHVSNNVLDKMGKPRNEVYEKFVKKYDEINKKLGKGQFLVPYFISSHPGSTLNDAIKLAEYVRDNMGYMPEQVQDFYPTPGTMSTCMYYTEIDPENMKQIYVPKTMHEKAMQRALMQYKRPSNYNLVHEALTKAGRIDLIGNGEKCLIKGENKVQRTNYKLQDKRKEGRHGANNRNRK